MRNGLQSDKVIIEVHTDSEYMDGKKIVNAVQLIKTWGQNKHNKKY